MNANENFNLEIKKNQIEKNCWHTHELKIIYTHWKINESYTIQIFNDDDDPADEKIWYKIPNSTMMKSNKKKPFHQNNSIGFSMIREKKNSKDY